MICLYAVWTTNLGLQLRAQAWGRRSTPYLGRIRGANHNRDGAIKTGNGRVRPVQRARDGVETRLATGRAVIAPAERPMVTDGGDNGVKIIEGFEKHTGLFPFRLKTYR